MKSIIVDQAREEDMDWVNAKYDEVDFLHSNYRNEFIVIAEVNKEKAGLGRLVKIDERNIELGGIYVYPEFRGFGVAEKIVSKLCDDNPFNTPAIWCLPFKNLLDFYARFGFQIYSKGAIPEEIRKKYERYAYKLKPSKASHMGLRLWRNYEDDKYKYLLLQGIWKQ